MGPHTPPFSTSIDRIDDVPVLRLFGELDLGAVDDLHKEFTRIIDEGVTSLVVDATHLDFIDSRGLHALVDCTHLIHGEGQVAVVPSTAVRRILEIADLATLLHAVDTMDEALLLVGRGTDGSK